MRKAREEEGRRGAGGRGGEILRCQLIRDLCSEGGGGIGGAGGGRDGRGAWKVLLALDLGKMESFRITFHSLFFSSRSVFLPCIYPCISLSCAIFHPHPPPPPLPSSPPPPPLSLRLTLFHFGITLSSIELRSSDTFLGRRERKKFQREGHAIPNPRVRKVTLEGGHAGVTSIGSVKVTEGRFKLP